MSTPPDPFALDDQLCFALYRASRATTAAYAQVLEGYGLSYPQYLVLLALWEAEPMTVGELGRRLSLTSATLSPLLRRLERDGRVQRTRSTDDGRSVVVELTEQGRALRPVAEQAQRCAAAGTDLTLAELHQLRDLAQRLADGTRTDVDHAGTSH